MGKKGEAKRQNYTNQQKKDESPKKTNSREIANALKGLPFRVYPVKS